MSEVEGPTDRESVLRKSWTESSEARLMGMSLYLGWTVDAIAVSDDPILREAYQAPDAEAALALLSTW